MTLKGFFKKTLVLLAVFSLFSASNANIPAGPSRGNGNSNPSQPGSTGDFDNDGAKNPPPDDGSGGGGGGGGGGSGGGDSGGGGGNDKGSDEPSNYWLLHKNAGGSDGGDSGGGSDDGTNIIVQPFCGGCLQGPGASSETLSSPQDCPCATEAQSINFEIPFGNVRGEAMIPNGRLFIERENPSPTLFSPQGLSFDFNFCQVILSDVGGETSPGTYTDRTVTIQRPNGFTVQYLIKWGDTEGLPVDRQVGAPTRIIMLDASMARVTDHPAYHMVETGDGGYILFNAATKKVEKITSRSGRTLKMSDTDVSVDVVFYEGGGIRQVWSAADGLANVLVNDQFSYRIDLYGPEVVEEKTWQGNNHMYQVTGQPHTTWTVENPARDNNFIDHVRITKSTSQGASSVQDWHYVASSGEWKVVLGGGLRTATKDGTWNDAKTELTNTTRILGPDDVAAYVKKQISRKKAWGMMLEQEIVDPDGAALTTTTAYYENSSETGKYAKVKSVQYPDGSWVVYDYDSMGRKTLEVLPYKDSPFNSSVTQARAVYYTYSPVDSGDTADLTYRLPRKVEERIMGVTVKRTYYAYKRVAEEWTETVERCPNPSAAYGDSSNERTVTTYYGTGESVDEELRGRKKSVLYPDGKKDTYAYDRCVYYPAADPANCTAAKEFGALALRTMVVRGTAASPDGIAGKTTMEVYFNDDFGNMVMNNTFVFNGSGYETIGRKVNYFDSQHRLTKTWTLDGRLVETTWNCCSKSSEKKDDGVEYAYAQDLLYRTVSETRQGHGDQPSMQTSYAYDANNNTLSKTVSGGGLSLTTSYEYDKAGRLTKIITPDGLVTTVAYANGGRTKTVTRPGGFTEVESKRLDGSLTSLTGSAVVGTYSDHGANSEGVRWIKENTGSATSPRWGKKFLDGLGRVVSEERPGGDGGVVTTQYFYNTKGWLAKVSRTGMSDTLYEHDDLGNVTRSGLDTNGNGTLDLASSDRISDADMSFEKDGADWWRVERKSVYAAEDSATSTTVETKRKRLTGFAAGTASEERTVDVDGNQTVATVTIDRANKTVTASVDTPESSVDVQTVTVNGLLTSLRSASDVTTAFEYDGLGRRVGVVDPRKGRSTTHYDSAGRVDYAEDAASNRTSLEYDPETGRRSAVVNPLGKRTEYAYNSRGQVTSARGDADYPADFEYNTYGERTSLKTYRENLNTPDVTTWAFQESTGLLLTKTDAANRSVSYAYRADGRLLTRTWSRTVNGQALVTTYSYDGATGDLLGSSYSDGTTPSVSYTYNRLGQQKTVGDAAGTRTFTYNSSFRLLSEAMSGLYSKTITRSYATEGVIGRYTGMGIGSEYGLTYGYDAYGRLNSVANGADTFTYGYVADSDLTGSVTYPNNISVTNTYEAQRDLLTSVENKHGATTISRYDYANNAIGNRVSMAKSGTAFAQADTITYGYNDRSEVTSATAQNDTTYNYAYGYDNIGNRVTATEAGTAKAYTSNALNQYTAITNPAQAPAYDNDGDMTSDGTGWTYTWDAENRLKSATNGTRTLEFKYDYLSRRVEKKVTDSGAVSKHLRFVYDDYKCVEKLNALDGNVVSQKFVWQDETLLSMSDSAGTCYYLQDANKNIGQVLDSSGAFKARYEYSPFGKLTVAEDASGNPFRFSSEYFDEETGLVYYNFRYYSPDLGRWLSKDPIEEESGWNLYCMVRNNPITLWDLLGLEDPCLCLKSAVKKGLQSGTELGASDEWEKINQESLDNASDFEKIQDQNDKILLGAGKALGVPKKDLDKARSRIKQREEQKAREAEKAKLKYWREVGESIGKVLGKVYRSIFGGSSEDNGNNDFERVD